MPIHRPVAEWSAGGRLQGRRCPLH